MKGIFKSFLCFICVFVLIQCDKEADKYYERPDWLEDPIYQVLEQQNRFSIYLQCVDRTQYADVLKGAGLYTVFAPNDAAFTAWLSRNHYASAAAIPQEVVNKIVAYSMAYNTFILDSLGVGGAFKFKTQLYALPYRDPEFNNEWVVDNTILNGWTNGANNYKFLPTFTTAFFNSFQPALTAEDYNVFYPGVTWTGRNVQDGEILRADIRAENGIIHEVSTVNLPLDHIADILCKPEHSGFKALLDSKNVYGNYLFRSYREVTAPEILKLLQKIMPNEDIQRIYYKFYYFNLENVQDFASGMDQPETAGFTVIIPTNEALQEYLDRRVLKYYRELRLATAEILATVYASHFAQWLVWPAGYAVSLNINDDFLNGEGSAGNSFDESGITGATLASNGFVYHSDKVIRSRLFESVYSEIFLNPDHKWVNTAYRNFFYSSLREDLQKCVLNGYISERYTLLTFDDELLREDGLTYNEQDDTFSHSVGSVNANTRLQRLMREHVFAGLNNDEVNSEITDFATAGISQYENWNFTVTSYGDPVRYRDNQMQAAGNIEDNTYVTLTKLDETYLNGTVWSADGLLQYSPRVSGASDDVQFRDLTLWEYLDRARAQNPNVKSFVDYFQQCIKTYPDEPLNPALDNIATEQFYTILMPNTAAMQSAVNAGILPPLAQVNPGNPEAFAKAAFFINSHILQGRVFVDDNIQGYLYPANPRELNKALVPVLAKVNSESLGLTNQTLLMEVSKNASGLLSFAPQSVTQGSTTLVTGRTSGNVAVQRGRPPGTTIPNSYRSNRIACKAILHEVNNYFIFRLEE